MSLPPRVLITGSNRGIGRETARLFGLAGASVAINGRDEARLNSVCEEFAELGISVIPIPGDISDPNQAPRIVSDAVRALGGLDVLVNNAALAMRGPVSELTPGVVERIVSTNVIGTANITVAALPHIRQSHGSVVFISSLAGLWGFPLISIYGASKMALTAFAQSMHAELSGDGVHIGIVHVGLTQHDDDKRILAADGSPYPLDARPRAASQVRVARAILRLVRRRRRRVVLTPAGHILELCRRLFPRLVGAIVRKSSKRVLRIAK